MINLRGLEGIGHGVIEVLPQKLAGGTKKNHEIRQSEFPVFKPSFEMNTSGVLSRAVPLR
jgi:hypothetical protein